jgi:hypothetical protein
LLESFKVENIAGRFYSSEACWEVLQFRRLLESFTVEKLAGKVHS